MMATLLRELRRFCNAEMPRAQSEAVQSSLRQHEALRTTTKCLLASAVVGLKADVKLCGVLA